jgi:hypothetical protein
VNVRLNRGDVLCSSESAARFLVLDAGVAAGVPSVNGVVMFRGIRRPCSAVAEAETGCDLQGGVRYVDVVTGLVLLCIRPGRGLLSYGGRRLTRESHGRQRPLVAATRS